MRYCQRSEPEDNVIFDLLVLTRQYTAIGYQSTALIGDKRSCRIDRITGVKSSAQDSLVMNDASYTICAREIVDGRIRISSGFSPKITALDGAICRVAPATAEVENCSESTVGCTAGLRIRNEFVATSTSVQKIKVCSVGVWIFGITMRDVLHWLPASRVIEGKILLELAWSPRNTFSAGPCNDRSYQASENWDGTETHFLWCVCRRFSRGWGLDGIKYGCESDLIFGLPSKSTTTPWPFISLLIRSLRTVMINNSLSIVVRNGQQHYFLVYFMNSLWSRARCSNTRCNSPWDLFLAPTPHVLWQPMKEKKQTTGSLCFVKERRSSPSKYEMMPRRQRVCVLSGGI